MYEILQWRTIFAWQCLIRGKVAARFKYNRGGGWGVIKLSSGYELIFSTLSTELPLCYDRGMPQRLFKHCSVLLCRYLGMTELHCVGQAATDNTA